jgi:hypothetical protein
LYSNNINPKEALDAVEQTAKLEQSIDENIKIFYSKKLKRLFISERVNITKVF